MTPTTDNKKPVVDGLALTFPTAKERTRTWTATHPQWGPALSLQGYLDREAHIGTLPLSRDGGMTQWILTEAEKADAAAAQSDDDQRPLLSSCDTLRKKALVRDVDGRVRDGFAHGVASVFTYPEARGKGYAGKMMTLLGETWRRREEEQKGEAMFSVLYSDIGKNFYAARGWKCFESSHLELPKSSGGGGFTPPENVKPILYDDLAQYASLDEHLLRQSLSRPSSDTSKIRVAIIPDLDHLQWHLLREDFMCKHIFSRIPTVRGAVYHPPKQEPAATGQQKQQQQRVWAIWSRNFYGGAENPKKNVLSLLRFVVEDEDMTDEDLAEGIEVLLTMAQVQAGEWLCEKVEMWNPTERIRRLALGINGLGCTHVEREDEGIASLNWFGEGPTGDVEWVANEKFGWC